MTSQFLFSKKSDYRKILFLIVPIILLTLGYGYLNSTGYFFLKCVDPEYAYLFNGLILADMHPDVPYVDHPGTLLQCIIAMVIWMVKLFRPSGDMISDVIKNPEVYIHATIQVINFLGASILALLGLFTFKKTGNIYLAFLVQLIPFVHRLGMEPLARLIPESLMLPLTCYWMIVFIWMAADPDRILRMKKYSMVLGILFGLSVANKLTYLPFMVLPLFILTGWQNKLRFSVTSIIAFFVFAFPILFKYKSFYTWVRNIIFHTGKYGSGDKGIINSHEFWEHIKLLIDNMPFLVMSVLILALAGVVHFIKTRRKDGTDRFYSNAAIGLLLLVILQFIFTAKQFSYHYMLPSILLTFPMIILSFIMMRRVFLSRNATVGLTLIFAVIFSYVFSVFIPEVRIQLKQMYANKNSRMESFMQLKKSGSARPLIVSASYYGCSAVEYALTFGLHMSGKYGPGIYEKMKIIYPSVYLYYPWGKVFYAGNYQILPATFMNPGNTCNLFIADYTKERLDEILTLLNSADKDVQWSAREVYSIPVTNEALFELRSK